MCKHQTNVQVQIRAPCCKRWFDCAQCHNERADHELLRQFELVFGCKKCKKVFRKDMTEFEEADEYCPHCDNHFVVEPEMAAPGSQVGSAGAAKAPQVNFEINPEVLDARTKMGDTFNTLIKENLG